MPTVNGIVETCLYVSDVARATDWYRDVLGLEVLSQEERMSAIAVAGGQLLLLFKKGATREAVKLPGGVIPPHDGEGQIHAGFGVAAGELDAWEARLRDRGVTIEGRMTWSRGGRSIYFRDPDGNLLELLTPGVWSVY
jgi:catechol 2,3-dioxygenase-like lactoylglutathione lyase family enzyme